SKMRLYLRIYERIDSFRYVLLIHLYIESIIANETLQYNRDIDQIQAIENGTVDKL
ncbi:MAG: hypothetical protein EPS19_02450, partial [Candidatus Liberibacter solanacearum]